MMEAHSLKLVRLKHVSWLNMGQSPPSSEYTDSPDAGLPFLQGTADFGDVYPTPQVYCPTPNKVADKDDILISVRAPVGELNIADQRYGIGRGLCAVKCGRKLDREFAWWALHWSREQLALKATGSTYEAVALEDIADILLPSISIEQQQVIAKSLGEKTAVIDQLITAKERLITLLDEKRRALITHAVTRGLDTAVPLRDSGVEWIGRVPEHWETEFARWLLREIDVRSETGAEELLSVSHITGVTPRSEKDVNMFMAQSLEGYKVCQPGDLVINTLWAWMGAMGVSFQEGIVSPSYHVYRPGNKLNPKYLDYLVRLPVFATEVNRYSKGVWSSRLRLYPQEFFQIGLPIPPLVEQEEIVHYLEQETEKLDNLKNALQKTITLLQERRTALIAAAVSGQHPVAVQS